jgi:hypothetical protein
MEGGVLGPRPRIRVAGTICFFNRIILWLSPLSIEFIWGINRSQQEADHYPLLNAEANGTLQFTSGPLHALYFCCTSFTVCWMLFIATYCDLTGYECAVVT